MKKLTSTKICIFLVGIFIASAFYVYFCLGNSTGQGFGKIKKVAEYVTGFWLMGAMLLAVLFSLKLPLVVAYVGGKEKCSLWHQICGVVTCILLLLHWAAACSMKWATFLGFCMGRARVHGAMHTDRWFHAIYRFLGHQADFIGYIMLVLFVLILFMSAIGFARWLWLHRLFAWTCVIGTIHGICSFSCVARHAGEQAVGILAFAFSVWMLCRVYRNRKGKTPP